MKNKLFAALLFAGFVGQVSNVVSAKTVSIGTPPQGSLAYASGAAIAKVATEATGDNFRVVPQGGPPVIVPSVNVGRMEFGLIASVAATYGYRGIEIFKKANPDIRVVSALYPIRLGMAVRRDSGIGSLQDLKGHRLASELVKQKNTLRFTEAYLESAGLSFDDVTGVPVPNFARGVEALQADKVDSSIASIGSGIIAQANASINGGVKFLELENGSDIQKIIDRLVPSAYVDTIEPNPSRVGIDGASRVLAQDLLLITGVETPDELVYQVAKALASNKPALVSAVGAFEGYNPGAVARELPVPYHPGAIRYLKEQGSWQ
ncbi:C4-dicarboxylate ABC transporter [Marinobacterium nitratireducens]|uniref:C4-dicarboxylate ABC transporter n=1 Tax=Marinobacterium nitratireducens TaxID=518897 RepID=A0A917ZI38_9GAMM|nr:TAXI family TRAP transporter solute-binding subunit [Marinobacterium nitratireducens]GGO83391.1 C4-dicarboxylate ABC transporter [Marinobacterium nitratireducens]